MDIKKEIFDTIAGIILSASLLAAGYYAGSKRAVKTFGDLDNRQDCLENRVWVLEKRLDMEAKEAEG